ncbi:transglutaminase family protein [Thermodesulfobacteriota bacterium]
MEFYLRATEIIDWKSPVVLDCARALSADASSRIEIAKSCYEWVRDHISHSGDHKATVTTCRASHVISEGTGWCFAKSHLLAALLRANDIPSGLCYQRLARDDGNGFTLHGLNAVLLPKFGWFRIDARGNKPGVNAQFCPPKEKLAFSPQSDEEFDFPEIWPDPAQLVLDCLSRCREWEQVVANLPDIPMAKRPQNLSLNRSGGSLP